MRYFFETLGDLFVFVSEKTGEVFYRYGTITSFYFFIISSIAYVFKLITGLGQDVFFISFVIGIHFLFMRLVSSNLVDKNKESWRKYKNARKKGVAEFNQRYLKRIRKKEMSMMLEKSTDSYIGSTVSDVYMNDFNTLFIEIQVVQEKMDIYYRKFGEKIKPVENKKEVEEHARTLVTLVVS